jgi:hypothetical protein
VSFAVVSTAAAQQGGWLIESSNIVSPSQPTTTIEVWAWFEDPLQRLAFSGGNFDVHASQGEVFNPQVLIAATLGSTQPGGEPGDAQGNMVTNARVFQLWGGLLGLPNTSNWGSPTHQTRSWFGAWTGRQQILRLEMLI